MRPWKWTTSAIVFLAGGSLLGCSGDGSASNGRLSLSLTDAPVDHAEALYLTVTDVTLQGVGGSRDQGPFAVPPGQAPVNLMVYTGTDSAALLSGVVVPAGRYKVRLGVDLSFTAQAQSSWIAFARDAPECRAPLPAGAVLSEDRLTCRYPLIIPNGEPSGFRPKGELTIEAGGTSHVTVEFDLRRNVADPETAQEIAFLFKPTGLRLVNDAAAGTIAGVVDAELFPAGCTPTDARVYLYDRAGATGPFVPDDMYPANEAVVTSVDVDEVSSPPAEYRYLIGFVPAGPYAVAVTCGTEDDPDADDDQEFFATADGLMVIAGAQTVPDLSAVPEALTSSAL